MTNSKSQSIVMDGRARDSFSVCLSCLLGFPVLYARAVE